MMIKIRSLVLFTMVPFMWINTQEKREPLDIHLSNYPYPFDVRYFDFESQGEQMKMAYMDVHEPEWNGKTVVLLHGKNFNGAYWKTTAKALMEAGYRVIMPDQIGFGKSSKPIIYQFSFQQLAVNTKRLLDELKIDKIYLLGHSMGGMVATRFSLMYPDMVEKLILENPIGLEDWKLVVPYTTIDEHYEVELKTDFESAKAYQAKSYYDNQWKPEYDEWVYLLTGWVEDPDYPIVAMNNALTSDMVFTQPVVYEFANLEMPTLLIIGTRDRTAIGKDKVKDPSVREKLGQYQILGKETQRKIPRAELIELENVGHLPHIEAFDRFIEPLKGFLN